MDSRCASPAAPARRLLDAGRDALEIGIGQAIQSDGVGKTKQRFGGAEQMILQGVAVLVECVGCPIQALQIHRFDIKVDQFSQRGAFLQPRRGRQFATRMRHAPDDK